MEEKEQIKEEIIESHKSEVSEGLEAKPQSEQEPTWKGPLKIILAIFLLLILVFWTLSYYLVKLDPEPGYIPKVEEVIPADLRPVNQTYANFNNAIKPDDIMIKQAADKIVSLACEGNEICQAKALYYFVRDNLQYVKDPVNFEYVEDPKTVLSMKTGDCESGTILLASLLGAIGIDSEIVVIPNHALLKIKLDGASNRYKIDNYIYLDWTCNNCKFGEVSLNVREFI